MATTATTLGALARAGLYRLLALGFAYPAPDVREEFLRVLELHVSQEPQFGDFRADLAALRLGDSDELIADYTRLFDRMIECSPYESDNVGGMRAFTKARDLADVQGFYRAFGLELGEDAAEMNDHIGIELEFASVLALKEAYFQDEGNNEGLEITLDARRAFLRDHVARWVPAFCERLAASAGHPFYRALAGVTRAVVAADVAEVGVVVPTPAAGPGTPEPDEFGCGA
ncbi:MAG: molecular chaperone TorD family protein [Candidatus Sericytochromatia bacterium]|nr:molecular chaperone TorD family protein [Candidatus Tanganyikabacteria bacterium]